MRKYTATFIFIKEDLDVKKSSQVSPWEKITCIKSWLIYKLIKNLTNYTQTTVKPFKFNLHLGYNHKSNTHIWAPDEMQLHKMQYCLHKLISTEIDDNTYLVCKTEGWNKLQCYDLVWYDLFFSLLSCDSFMNIKHTSFAFRKKNMHVNMTNVHHCSFGEVFLSAITSLWNLEPFRQRILQPVQNYCFF